MNLQVKTYSKEEIQLLWDNIDSTVPQALLILIHTGMRPEELLSLKTTDVHLGERFIEVKAGKTGRRLVPIHKDIMPIIEKKLAEEHEYLITDNDGEKTDFATFKRQYSAFCKEFGLKHSIHACRHTFVANTQIVGDLTRESD